MRKRPPFGEAASRSRTSYFVLVEATNGNFWVQGTNSHDQTGTRGWEIYDGRHQRASSTSAWETRTGPVRIKLLGTGTEHAATGKPEIRGMAQVGYALSAGLGTIADRNGIPETVRYQWVRVDNEDESDIAGARARVYAPGTADVGKKVKVRISFADEDGYRESRTSDAYPASTTIAGPAATVVGGETLLDNTQAARANNLAISGRITRLAQRFRTGTNQAGYILYSVGLDLISNEGSAIGVTVELTVRSGSGGGSPSGPPQGSPSNSDSRGRDASMPRSMPTPPASRACGCSPWVRRVRFAAPVALPARAPIVVAPDRVADSTAIREKRCFRRTSDAQPRPFHGISQRSVTRIRMSMPNPMMPIRMMPMITMSVS